MDKRLVARSQASAGAWTQEADAISLVRLDEVGALPRPSTISESYGEREYAALAAEQGASWSAEGEQQARPLLAAARGLDSAANAFAVLLAVQEEEVRQAAADYQHAVRVLSAYARREPGAKWRYWWCWITLIIGDLCGVWATAIMFGEVPWTAFGQALASGVAAGSSGLIGTEIKYLRLARARQRDPDALTEDERRYVRLFSGGTDKGLGLVALVGLVSVVVVLLVACGVWLLRASVEGSAAGFTFGLLAAATALGSFLLGYSSGDDIADLLAAVDKRVRRAEQRYVELAACGALKQRAEAEESARSVRAECELRGQAATARIESLSARIMRNNPQVFGHGFPAEGHGVGRRDRPPSSTAAEDGV